MNPYTYKISFRLIHPDSDLEIISKAVLSLSGFLLKKRWKKSEPRKTLDGKPMQGVYAESYCNFSFSETRQKSEVELLPSAIQKICQQLEQIRPVMNEHIASGGITSFFVGLFIDANSGVTIDRDLLQELSNLGIALEFDIYPPDKE